jgi:hypothetical protein
MGNDNSSSSSSDNHSDNHDSGSSSYEQSKENLRDATTDLVTDVGKAAVDTITYGAVTASNIAIDFVKADVAMDTAVREDAKAAWGESDGAKMTAICRGMDG